MDKIVARFVAALLPSARLNARVAPSSLHHSPGRDPLPKPLGRGADTPRFRLRSLMGSQVRTRFPPMQTFRQWPKSIEGQIELSCGLFFWEFSASTHCGSGATSRGDVWKILNSRSQAWDLTPSFGASDLEFDNPRALEESQAEAYLPR
jgi:hypothetical protein